VVEVFGGLEVQSSDEPPRKQGDEQDGERDDFRHPHVVMKGNPSAPALYRMGSSVSDSRASGGQGDHDPPTVEPSNGQGSPMGSSAR